MRKKWKKNTEEQIITEQKKDEGDDVKKMNAEYFTPEQKHSHPKNEAVNVEKENGQSMNAEQPNVKQYTVQETNAEASETRA